MTNVSLSGASESHDQYEHNVEFTIDQQCIFKLFSIPNCMFRVNKIPTNS
jgi:hypothetical protein